MLSRNNKQNIDEIDNILDSQIPKLASGLNIQKSKNQVPIKMVKSDIEFLFDQNGINTGMLVCGIATVDDIYYAALCDARIFPPKGYVEEIYMSSGGSSIKGVYLIKDPEEWGVIVHFFQANQVWETRRIMNWIFNVKNGNIKIKTDWIDDLNKKLVKQGLKPINQDILLAKSNAIINAETSITAK